MSTEQEALDPDEIARLSFMVWNYKQGEMVSLMVHLGVRLDIFAALDGAGPVTATQLADATGLHERWLLEWLRALAAAQLLTYHEPDQFELAPAAAMVLARSAMPSYAAGAFTAPRPPDAIDAIAEGFRTGIGQSYDAMGEVVAHQVEAMLGPFARTLLVPVVIPALTGTADRLTAGATVIDVGCGSGLALQLLAEAFPASRFIGFDPSTPAVAQAKRRMADAGLDQVEIHHAGADALPKDASADLIMTLDCIHDMPDPAGAIDAIRATVRDDGTWLIKDIRSHASFAENLRNPMLAMMYSTSVTTCLSSAMSEPGAAGLGTLGFNPEVAEEMSRAGGFSQFTMHDFEDPANLYYEVRP